MGAARSVTFCKKQLRQRVRPKGPGRKGVKTGVRNGAAPRVTGLGRGGQGSREEKGPRAETETSLPRPVEVWWEWEGG